MSRALLSFVVVVLGAGVGPWLGAQEEAPPAPAVVVEEVVVSPATPAGETLCKLSLRLRNDSEVPISALELDVRLDGDPLEVYERQLFMDLLPPGETTEVELFNFWTPEAGLKRLEVELEGASWMKVETEEDGTEVWTLTGAVENLPPPVAWSPPKS